MMILQIEGRIYEIRFFPRNVEHPYQVWDLEQDCPAGEWMFSKTPLSSSYTCVGVQLETINPIDPPLILLTDSRYNEDVSLTFHTKPTKSINC